MQSSIVSWDANYDKVGHYDEALNLDMSRNFQNVSQWCWTNQRYRENENKLAPSSYERVSEFMVLTMMLMSLYEIEFYGFGIHI